MEVQLANMAGIKCMCSFDATNDPEYSRDNSDYTGEWTEVRVLLPVQLERPQLGRP